MYHTELFSGASIEELAQKMEKWLSNKQALTILNVSYLASPSGTVSAILIYTQ